MIATGDGFCFGLEMVVAAIGDGLGIGNVGGVGCLV